VASDSQIANFDAAAVRAGIRLAMQVGLPVMPDDQPMFFFPAVVTTDRVTDSQGVSFDAGYRPTRTQLPGVKVPCAIDYKDAVGRVEAPGMISPSGVVLTLLDEDYAKVKGFAYVVIGGIKYAYERVEKPTGLVSVGIYTVHCLSDDEG
jgi:hypothetical protein